MTRTYEDEYPLKVIRRTEDRGLTTAVLKGVQVSEHGSIVVMDADLQHPPETIPDLLQELEAGHDVVVGSRYAPGGDFGDFGRFRRMLSRVADLAGRTVFWKAREVQDILSGFFAFRKSVVKNVELSPVGFKILLEILVLYSLTSWGLYYLVSGAIAIETGLLSNFFFNKFWTYRERRVQGLHRILKALGRDHLVRSGGMVMNLLILWMFTDLLGVYYLISQIVGISAGTLWNFVGNEWWTWES